MNDRQITKLESLVNKYRRVRQGQAVSKIP